MAARNANNKETGGEKDGGNLNGAPNPFTLAREIRSTRLRGLLRHAWLNQGLEDIAAPSLLHWSTSVIDANILRANVGLPLLDPNHDPAPDVAANWEPEFEAEPSSRTFQVNGHITGHLEPVATTETLPLMDILQWTSTGRLLIFALASTSIGCMLVGNSGLLTTRSFFYALLLPACLMIAAIAHMNQSRGDRRLFAVIGAGALAGLAGAAVLNILRVPFAYSNLFGLDHLGISQIPFFDTQPRLGSILLGQPVEQPSYGIANYILGWSYHLIRGMTTGIMCAMLIGEIRSEMNVAKTFLDAARARAIARGVLLTVVLKIIILFAPGVREFSFDLSPQRVVVMLLAHASFGVAIGLLYAYFATRPSASSAGSAFA